MKKTEAYSTLHEIRLRKETILSEIRNDNQQISILWKDLFRKPEPRKKRLHFGQCDEYGSRTC